MSKKELIGCIGGLILLVSTCFGVYSWLDARFAQANDLIQVRETMQKLSTRLDYKILDDRIQDTRRKIWAIEDRYCSDKSKPCTEERMPPTVRDHYRDLKCEKEKLEKELEELKQLKK